MHPIGWISCQWIFLSAKKDKPAQETMKNLRISIHTKGAMNQFNLVIIECNLKSEIFINIFISWNVKTGPVLIAIPLLEMIINGSARPSFFISLENENSFIWNSLIL